MTTTIRNAANSAAGTSLVDADLNAQLYVAADGYYFGVPRPVVLTGAGAQITVAGHVIGDNNADSGAGATGIVETGGGASLVVESTGRVTGYTAVKLSSGTVVNDGVINGYRSGIVMSGYTGYVANHGTVHASYAAVSLAGEQLTLENTGLISGKIIGTVASNMVTIENAGTIRGEIILSGDDNRVKNSGTISERYIGGDGYDFVFNAGVMSHVVLRDGVNTFTSHGTVNGGVTGGTGTDLIFNSGHINGNVNLGDATVGYANHIQNSGDINGKYIGGTGYDDVVNSGRIMAINLATGATEFAVQLGGGSNSVENMAGGVIFGITAGAGTTEILNEGLIQTGIKFTGGQNAIHNSGKIAGLIEGGNGVDTIDNTDGVITGLVSLRNGNDTYLGGRDAERICGAAGLDTLAGRGGADTFIYKSVGESTVADAGRDVILDFTSGSDKINLFGIDASAAVAGNQNFTFIGAGAFTGVAGELHYSVVNGTTLVSADVNGDKIADFAINLKGAMMLSSADFVL